MTERKRIPIGIDDFKDLRAPLKTLFLQGELFRYASFKESPRRRACALQKGLTPKMAYINNYPETGFLEVPLIESNYYFVDKTTILKDLIDNVGQVILFTQPERFGKTLNLSMIRYYFEKTDDDNSHLFENYEYGGKIHLTSRTISSYQSFFKKYETIKL